MITFSDWLAYIFKIPGGPKVVIQEPDFDNIEAAGILTIYCHNKKIKYFKTIDQYNEKPVGHIWVFKSRSHAWLKRNSGNHQIILWNGKVELK